jgi:hypothetical protein
MTRSPGRPYLSAPLGLGFEHLKVFLEDALRSLEIGKGGFGNSDGSGGLGLAVILAPADFSISAVAAFVGPSFQPILGGRDSGLFSYLIVGAPSRWERIGFRHRV